MYIRHRLTLLAACSLVGLLFFHGVKNTSGPGGGRTGAPGETTCISCHGGQPLNPGPFQPTIALSGGGTSYTPGQTYTITITAAEPNISKFGFQSTILQSNGSMAGTVATNQPGTKIANANISGNARTYIEQNAQGVTQTSPGQRVWTYTWNAPSTNVGNVTVYVVVNHTNNNNSTSGDKIYTNTLVLTPAAVPVNSITTGNPAQTSFCAGQAVSIPFTVQGTFASGNTFTAQLSDASGGFANPVTLGSVVGTGSGSISGNIPAGTGAGTGYRVRVVSNDPAVTGTANTTNLTINSVPTVTASASATSICAGIPTVLSATSSVAGSTFSWQPGNLNGNSANVSPGTTTTYTVTATTPGGCTNTATITVNVSPALPVPVITTTTPPPFCAGSSVTVQTNPVPNVTYTWSVNGQTVNGTNAPTLTVNNVQPNEVIGLQIQQTGGPCVAGATPITLNVAPLPAAPQANCGNTTTSSVEIVWNAVLNASGYEVSTDGGQTWQSTGTATAFTQTGLAAGSELTTRVRAQTTACGPGPASNPVSCSAVNCSPLTFQTSSLNLTRCPGAVDTLRILNPGFVQYTYAWSGNGSVVPGNNTQYVVTASNQPQTVEVSISDPSQPLCTPAKATFTIAPPSVCPSAALTVSSSKACVNTLVTVRFTGTAGPGAQFTWDFDGGIVESGTGLGPYNVRWTAPGNRRVRLHISDFGATSSDSSSLTVFGLFALNVLPTNASTATARDGAISWQAVNAQTPLTAYVRQNGTILDSARTSTPSGNFTGLASGTYLIEVKDAASCVVVAQNVTISFTTSRLATLGTGTIQLAPNPVGAGQMLQVLINEDQLLPNATVYLRLHDPTGRLVWEETFTPQPEARLTLPNHISGGWYRAVVSSPSGMVAQQALVVQP